ncbi:isochorismatase family protein [Aquabacterium sp. A7-Y]|uniref:isochorismatase family protein n=1 Tax=Aquabacterium sp. A7-Y TaxID=1349605 RepID=UPI00223D2A21|nr:isochorismatase family protein [Aquabacterium sp. A7-Y]MCW7539253.1 isochorismatase family protein [Aquabacterium sp. A7-Y]
MKHRTHLLLIDPQNDFCDLPAEWCPLDPLSGARLGPALPVPGAHADMQRVAQLIDAAGGGLDQITVTLDSHHRIDIAHPAFWSAPLGEPVPPFTAITAAQVRAGQWRPREAGALPRALAYLDELEARGRYTLMVWPVHCEIGSWGHNVHSAVRAAYNRWEEATLTSVHKVVKGDNPWTEHYSALLAEVPDADDPDTQLNRALIERLDEADLILVAGEASSHCVKATTEHLVANLGGRPDRVVLLTDCMSPVAGFEAQHAAFLADMRARGVRLATSKDVASLLPV